MPKSWSVHGATRAVKHLFCLTCVGRECVAECSSTVQLLLGHAGGMRVCPLTCPECCVFGGVDCETDKLQPHCAGVAVWFASRCVHPPVAVAGQPLPGSTAYDSSDAATARQLPLLKHQCQWYNRFCEARFAAVLPAETPAYSADGTSGADACLQ